MDDILGGPALGFANGGGYGGVYLGLDRVSEDGVRSELSEGERRCQAEVVGHFLDGRGTGAEVLQHVGHELSGRGLGTLPLRESILNGGDELATLHPAGQDALVPGAKEADTSDLPQVHANGIIHHLLFDSVFGGSQDLLDLGRAFGVVGPVGGDEVQDTSVGDGGAYDLSVVGLAAIRAGLDSGLNLGLLIGVTILFFRYGVGV